MTPLGPPQGGPRGAWEELDRAVEAAEVELGVQPAPEADRLEAALVRVTTAFRVLDQCVALGATISPDWAQ